MEKTFMIIDIMKYINKILSNMEMQVLNLEIQLAQIKDDASARGAMVAAEHIKKEIELLRQELGDCKRSSF